MSRDIFLRLLATFFIVFLIFALHRIITVSARPTRPALVSDRPLLIAHRGGAALAPENTLEAFRNAIRLGVDALQLDVRLTADGALVVIHDETVDRTTNGSGLVRDMTLAELQALDAGFDFTSDGGASYPYRGQGVSIPTLAAVLAEFPRTRLNINLKDPLPEAAARLTEEIDRANASDRVIIASSHGDTLSQFRRLAPQTAAVAGSNETRTFYYLNQLGLWRLHRPLGDAYQTPPTSGRARLDTPQFIEHAHAFNQKVHYDAVDDPAEMRRLLDLGADGIITDRPDLALEVFRERGDQ